MKPTAAGGDLQSVGGHAHALTLHLFGICLNSFTSEWGLPAHWSSFCPEDIKLTSQYPSKIYILTKKSLVFDNYQTAYFTKTLHVKGIHVKEIFQNTQNIIVYNLLVPINIFEVSEIHNKLCQVLVLQKWNI